MAVVPAAMAGPAVIDGQAVQGAVTLLTGIVLGAGLRSLPPRRRGPRPLPAPACQCGHPRALHDPATNECHQQVRIPQAGTTLSHHAQCRCRQYVGPEPMPELFARGLELPGGD